MDTPCLDHLIKCNRETRQWGDTSFLPKCLEELSALKATASRAEALERVRIAAANVAAMYQTDPLTTVDGLTDTDFIMRISALRAALAAQGGGT